MKASVPAAAAGMIDVAGDLTVARLGYGAMRITGPGVWGEAARPGPGRAGDPGGFGAEPLQRGRRVVGGHGGPVRAGDADVPAVGTGPLHRGQPGGPRRRPEARREPRQVVLAWLLARSPRMLPIPGSGSPEHVAENVAAAGSNSARTRSPRSPRTPDAGIPGLPEATWSPSRRSPGTRHPPGRAPRLAGGPVDPAGIPQAAGRSRRRPRGLAQNRRARTPRLRAAARPEHRSMSTEGTMRFQ
jgi:hypothetical protein